MAIQQAINQGITTASLLKGLAVKNAEKNKKLAQENETKSLRQFSKELAETVNSLASEQFNVYNNLKKAALSKRRNNDDKE